MSTTKRNQEKTFSYHSFWGSVKDIQRAAEKYAEPPVEGEDVPDVLKEPITLSTTILPLYRNDGSLAQKVLLRHLHEGFRPLRFPLDESRVVFFGEEDHHSGFRTAFAPFGDNYDVVIWSDIFQDKDGIYHARCGLAYAPLMEIRRQAARDMVEEEKES